MNTRSRGRLSPSFAQGGDYVKRNAAANTELFQEQTAELGQAPIFNIHIHMPANNNTDAPKIHLPRIQPVIHVHFDELGDKLRNNASQQEGGLSEKYVQTLIKQITPKFGTILFHHKNNSFNGNSKSIEINTFKPNQPLRGKNSSNELESSNNDTKQNQNSENLNKSVDNGPSKRTQEIKGDKLSSVVYNGHPIKLKKAKVVLEDILQPSFYRSGRIRNLLGKISVSQYSPSSLSSGVTNLGPQIKVEPAPSSPRSPTVHENEKLCTDSDDCLNSPDSTNSFGSVSFEFPNQEEPLKRESLASLVEGCNFSEILQKFRDKYRKYADKCLEASNMLAKAQTLLENNNVGPMQNYVESQKEEFWTDQSNDVDDKQEKEEDSKDWLNLQDKVKTNEIENQPQNSNEGNTEAGDCSNSVDPSVEESMSGDLGVERPINPFHVAEVNSVDNEITIRNKLSSDVVENLKAVEFDSCNPTPDMVLKSEFSVVETKNAISADTGDQYFDLTLVKKEMDSPKKGTDKMVNNENRNSGDSENESSRKKLKLASETAKKSTTRTKGDVNYIPLNISGPTKFAVAPLSNLHGYKAHAAQNFKKEMLFGKRINRYKNPQQLRIYKLKKQQKYCQNKKTLQK